MHVMRVHLFFMFRVIVIKCEIYVIIKDNYINLQPVVSITLHSLIFRDILQNHEYFTCIPKLP